MSTYYAFVTEPIYQDEEKVKEVEDALRGMQEETDISFTKYESRTHTIFSGVSRNLGGGFYEACEIPVKVVWVSDEDGNGISE